MKFKKGKTMLDKFNKKRERYSDIEDLLETNITDINIKAPDEKEWQQIFKEYFSQCKPNENNHGSMDSFIRAKLEKLNDLEKQAAQLKENLDLRVDSYRKIRRELKEGIFRSKGTDDKQTKQAFEQKMDREAPVPFFLKEEIYLWLITIIVMAEAVFSFILFKTVFNENPEINILLTISLSEGLVLLAMFAAYEMALWQKKEISHHGRIQMFLSWGFLALILIAYNYLRFMTKDVLNLASNAQDVLLATTIMLMVLPMVCSVSAFKLEYYIETSESIAIRKAYKDQYRRTRCNILLDSSPSEQEFEEREKTRLEAIKKNASEELEREVVYAIKLYQLFLCQKIHAEPKEISVSMNEF